MSSNSSSVQKEKVAVEEEELTFVVKRRPEQKVEDIETISEEVSPLSLTISELERTAELRRQKMKGFNYKFTDQVNKNIDEIERQPAYKRLGVNLDEVNSEISKSRTTLSTDASDDAQLRSNNSFLHDNVD
jgi:cell division protein FtsZ